MDMRSEFFVRAGQSETTEALREHALHRLSFALRRFRHLVRQVTIRLVDVNGPRGGVDSRCSITVTLLDGGLLFAQATAAWPFAAITQTVKRLSQSLRRHASRDAARRTIRASLAI